MPQSGMQGKIENAVAQGYGLPESDRHYVTEIKMCGVGRTGEVFEESYSGLSHKEVVDRVKELEKKAREHGIEIIFKKTGWGGKVKTETTKYETEDSGWFYPNSSWYESGTKKTVVKQHSYEILGYKSLNLIGGIEGLKDIAGVKKAIGGKTAEAALSVLDELYYQYSPSPLLYSASTNSLSEKIVDARKKKTLKTIELFGLNKGETYLGMEGLAKAALVEELCEIAIRTNWKWLGSWRANREFGKADERYKETVRKIKSVQNQFSMPA